jgi:hypothetical protein
MDNSPFRHNERTPARKDDILERQEIKPNDDTDMIQKQPQVEDNGNGKDSLIFLEYNLLFSFRRSQE